MEDNFNTMMREALKRRAERIEPLKPISRPLSISPRGGEGRGARKTHPIPPIKGGGGLRVVGWKTWSWVGSIAAMLVIGLFLFLGKNGTNETNQTNGSPADQVAVVPKGQGGEAETPAPQLPNTVPSTQDANVSAPSLIGRAGGESSKGNGAKSRHSAPSLTGRAGGESVEAMADVSDLYATIDQMTDQALRDAERQMIETLSRNVAADTPS